MSENIFMERIEWLNDGVPLLRGDKIEDQNGRIFEVRKEIGAGVLAHVYKVIETHRDGSKKVAAIKIPTNEDDSIDSIDYEGQVLDYLKERCRGISNKNLSYYKETVAINMHPCILMEYLGPSILNLLEANGLVGLSMRMIQDSMKCVLSTLKELASIGVMHMDVKPENILQSKDDVHLFKLIDFHCAGIMGRPNPSYVQSRFFRAPEVLLHVDYDMKIDVWSLAATAFEMFIGVPLFPGDTEVQMLYLINKMLGPFPESLIKNSPRRNTFFLADGKMKPADRLAEENMEDVKTWKSWFKYDTIADNIMTYSTISSTELSEEEYNNRRVFVDLLEKCLKLDPVERISANDALMHPFFSLKLE